MWLLASDYDGTYRRGQRPCGENLERVKAWRRAGNLFCLVTGRDIHLAMAAVEENNIPFDYLVCNNGGSIWDSSGSCLVKNPLPDQAVPEILGYLKAQEAVYAVVIAESGRVFIRDVCNGNFPVEYALFSRELDCEDAFRLSSVEQIATQFADDAVNLRETAALNERFGRWISAHLNIDCIDIVCSGVSKETGLKELLGLLPQPPERVIVIGDGQNDAGMIAEYEGYSITGASREARQNARGLYGEVFELIDDLLRH